MSNTKTRKLKIVRTSTQPLRLKEGEAIHVGVDVHKASYSVALYSAYSVREENRGKYRSI